VEPRSIDVGGQPLEFHLRRSNRRTLSISVEPDQRVVVTAPAEASEGTVAAVVRGRAQWIRRQQLAFEAMPPPPQPRKWVAGETHRYLGRQYRLKVVHGSPPSVRLVGPFFVVAAVTPTDPEAIRAQMDRWYREHAKALLVDGVARAIRRAHWLNLAKPPVITVRKMWKRWGSTAPSGRVYFNVDLVKAPLGCIEYVVVHELVHLRFPNHGPAFWRLLGRCLPDWKRWKERLERQEI
jgi:predicted metal-dependent hydrolase